MDRTYLVFTMLLNVLLLVMSKTASGTETIVAFKSKEACSGDGFQFSNVEESACNSFESAKGSVIFTGIGSCTMTTVYRDASCSDPVGRQLGPVCYIGGGFKSADIETVCRRRNLLANSTVKKAKKSCEKPQPDGIVYTEDYTKGIWFLPTQNATGLFSYLAEIPVEEKTNWLRNQGGYLQLPSERNTDFKEV